MHDIFQWLILRQATNELKQREEWHSFDSLPGREIELQNGKPLSRRRPA